LNSAVSKSPTLFRSNKPTHLSFIWDTGASYTVSPEQSDFEGGIQQLLEPIQLDGLATGLAISGKGKLKWDIVLDSGQKRSIMVDAFYVPSAHIRLLSPQSYIQQWEAANPHSTLDPPGGSLNGRSFIFKWEDGETLTVPFQGHNNLPTTLIVNEQGVQANAAAIHNCVTQEANQNLSAAQKELLQWHFKSAHKDMEAIKLVLASGALASSEGQKALHRAASKCPTPKCASCQYSKQRATSTPGSTSRPDGSAGNLSKGDLFPGERVSVDHFVCGTEGRLYDSKGRTPSTSMYHGGCIFVDHATGFVHVEHQVRLTSHETLLSKHKFEEVARDSGVIIQKYQSDNGSAFTSGQYTQHLTEFKQVTRFAGVGAHHQNGIAERNIQTIMSMARTMMIHAAIRWPETTDTCLWPMAVDYAVFIHNHLPNKHSGLSPIDLFTRTRWPTHKMNDLHVWGCPTYVLDPRVQDGKKLPKWTPRSRRGVFVGLSKRHASTAPLILNLDTLYISPQFHCVFDNWFSTVSGESQDPPPLADPIWDNLFGNSRFQYYFDNYQPPPLSDEWERYSTSQQQANRVRAAQDASMPPPSLPPMPTVETTNEVPFEIPSLADRGPPSTPIDGRRVRFPEDSVTSQREPSPPSPSHDYPAPDSPATPSQRETLLPTLRSPTVSSPQRALDAPASNPPTLDAAPASPTRRRSTRATRGQYQSLKYHEEFHYNGLTIRNPETAEDQAALAAFLVSAFVASKSDPDVLTYDQAMRDADADEWKEAMNKEIMSLVTHGTWEIIPKTAATGSIIPGTWVLRRKRKPDGSIKSLKARWCVRGDLQGQVDNTFAPVVQWSTIRMLLYFTLFFGMVTKSIDFSNAFVQAKLDESIFVHLPRGFSHDDGQDVCLKLLKSLYGISQAPRLWFDHLRDKLLKCGLRQSSLDPCLFYGNNIYLVVYVDDVIIASKDEKAIDALIAKLKTTSDFTDDGELSSFLGIDVTRDDAAGTFTLKQPGLTARIIAALGLADANPNFVPALPDALGSDLDGPPMTETWDYRSVIGMLLYLSNNSRPDIAFAVHQCARFSHAPKQSHATAVKTIGRYLLRTQSEGLILKPTGDLAIDLPACGSVRTIKTPFRSNLAPATSSPSVAALLPGPPRCRVKSPFPQWKLST
jgi:Reverse transcriptase (RNA-dependent DNA polymerase)